MHWINPSGAWALAALGIIICLYILRQKMEPIEVSSTYLWKKALASLEADRPFQKLRRNLLMFVQLLLALLLVLALMRPMQVGGEAAEVVFVIDLSASMQTEEGGATRLARAIEDANRRIDGLTEGARVSILTAGAQVSQPIARTNDRLAAKRALNALQAQNGSSDLDGALSLAFALQRELEDVQLIIYSDQELPDGSYVQPAVGSGQPNRAVLSLQANDTAAIARIINHGGPAEVELECYMDNVLCDIRTVSLQRDEVLSVPFALPGIAQTVEVRLVTPDALPIDNTRTWVRREEGNTSIVLAGRDNVFLEKALHLRGDVSVLKTTIEEVSLVKASALTVVDGPVPAEMPAEGALFLVDPDLYTGAMRTESATLSPAVNPLADQLNAYLQVDAIQTARWKPVSGGTPIWEINGEPVLSLFEEEGRRIAVLGFDLHASNLPLLKEFPIFMQHLLDFLVPEPLGAGFTDGECGEPLSIKPQSFARTAFVSTPSGAHISIPVAGGTLYATDEIGVYHLIQRDETGAETSIPFVLQTPASESNVQSVASRAGDGQEGGQGSAYGREWTPWLVALLLAVTLVEWWVYRREY